ncbi:hypothetical protein [Mariniblastus fucicola]|uniref:Uncharacterized protein n=1 Tax=Mariniblastus fucicola TaxID=980251 RepID=A0A5B9P8J3_9BACT|nr:hypothetical protein [Mariniblastus fucicola]QEG23047.1 hypothetical protein MFFC18_29390 [Mariniblastus fucicola]
MSDETKMNPDLESFAASLQSVPIPESKLDRDQLMYDAGWAAAIAQSNQTTKTRRRSLPTIALSFVSGIAVSAAVMLSVLPMPTGGSEVNSIQVAATDGQEVNANRPIDIAAAGSPEKTTPNRDEVDLLRLIENVPPGHSIDASFGSQAIAPQLAQTDGYDENQSTTPASRPQTSYQMMQELLPNVRVQNSAPAWSAWMSLGG